MNKIISVFCLVLISGLAFAADEATGGHSSLTPIGIGFMFGIAALGAALAQGKAVSAALESIGRNPSASGTVFTPMIIGLVSIESLLIITFAMAYVLNK